MINIFGINNLNNINNRLFDFFCTKFSLQKKQRLLQYRFKIDACRTLMGEIMTRYAIQKYFNILNHTIKFSYNQYKKPICSTNPEFHFNISHSGDRIVCAIDDNSAIGIDVEEIRPINFSISEHYFSENEYSQFLCINKIFETEQFYSHWTLKESYIKQTGKGLLYPLKSFSILKDGDCFNLYHGETLDRGVYFKQYHPDKKHIVSICGCSPNFPETITPVSLEELEYFFI